MPLWGPGRPRVSGMYEGWGLPGFLRNVTGQISQDCCPLAHLHSNDLHPWPHQTYPHLTVEKEQMRTMQVCGMHSIPMGTVEGMYCVPEGLPGRGHGSPMVPLRGNGSTPEAATNTPEYSLL